MFRSHPVLRPAALLTLAAFLFACTHEVPRETVAVRHYRVDWAAAHVPVLRLGGLTAQGVVLTPAQWPLEASLKNLLAADFTGVIEGLDLGFHSSTIPSGALEELHDEGYLPAYVRVENSGATPVHFDPRALSVRVDGDTVLPAVAPEDLPQPVRRIDWMQTGAVVVAVALLAILAVAAREGRSSNRPQVQGQIYINPQMFLEPHPFRAERERDRAARMAASEPPAPRDAGLLRVETLAPGEANEGFVLFTLAGGVRDWRTARLALGE